MKRTAKTLVPIVALTLGVFWAADSPDAQQSGKVPRIGFLGFASPPAAQRFVDAFRLGLRDLGYVEGQSIAIVDITEWSQ